MSVEWRVNGTPLADVGLTLAGGGFRTQGVSFATFDIAADFDAAEVWAYGTSVTLSHADGETVTPFFRGRIKRIGKEGRPEYEGHDYALEDAWADLEATIYQETWGIGAGSYLFPRAVLGIGFDTGTAAWGRIGVGTQIRKILEYAISVGVDLQIGSIPDGELLWPTEVSNTFCSELIQSCLRYHPDWLPWIDHTTSPPTFHVTPVDALDPLEIDVTGSEDTEGFRVTRRDDRLPASVRMVYEFATTIDDEVFRNAVIDKFPGDGPDGGPNVLQAMIPLAGLQMQTQKSRIQTRTIPTDESHAAAKSWIKQNYPHLANVAEEDFTVTSLTRYLIEDTEDHPEPINPRAERLSVTDVDDLPRQLVRGSIEDWMRVKVGRIWMEVTIAPAGGAGAPALAAISKGTPGFSCTATNATTKTYKGITQWIAPEDVPVGVAQAIYQSIHAGPKHDGFATITETEISPVRRYGKAANLTGGLTEWSEMNAPVHSVDWDVASGTSVVGFGPVPELAPADFLEYARMIRRRPTRWWSVDERAGNKIGSDTEPSASGDTVGGYDRPEVVFEPSGVGADDVVGAFFGLRTVSSGGADNGDIYLQGGNVGGGSGNVEVGEFKVWDASSAAWAGSAGQHLQLEITGDGAATSGILDPVFNVTAAAISVVASIGANTLPSVGSTTGKICRLSLGTFSASGFSPARVGNVNISFCWGGYVPTPV